MEAETRANLAIGFPLGAATRLNLHEEILEGLLLAAKSGVELIVYPPEIITLSLQLEGTSLGNVTLTSLIDPSKVLPNMLRQ